MILNLGADDRSCGEGVRQYNRPLSQGIALKFIITNDDGIGAPGIATLHRAMEGLGEIPRPRL